MDSQHFLLISRYVGYELPGRDYCTNGLKKLPEEVEKLHQAYPEASIELWSQDEHRIGLKPILRRVWARKGTRVRAVVRPRYQWMYLYVRYHLERSGR